MGKKAVLIGINYPGTDIELKGCINDVKRMHDSLIIIFGFKQDDITLLIDTDPTYIQPTGKNIRKALDDLVRSAEPGDYLFVHYSGHGTRIPPETGDLDDTGYDECIVPTDINLITDDDFKEVVCQVPNGCRFTIVSDSCHSGGLISDAKEQIGESTKKGEDNGGSSDFNITGFIKQTMINAKLRDSSESCGIHDGNHGYVKSRSLPLPMLIEMLKQQSGKDDIDVGKIRPTLFDTFGEDASPKVKKFVNILLGKLQGRDRGLMNMVGNLAQDFLKQKINASNGDYAKSAIETPVERKEEVYAGANKSLPRNGALLSGCQTDETSADASPAGNPDKAYGAFSNAIQIILVETNGSITNEELVTRARELLKREGFTQRPGLYCADEHAHAPFVCE